MKICTGLLLSLPALAVLHAQPVAAQGNAERGKTLYASVGCATCHGSGAQGAGTIPALAPPKHQLPDFVKFVRQPTGAMPAVPADKVSDAQLADIYAFLRTGPAASARDSAAANLKGNVENGKRLFMRDGCYQCHGMQGQGAYTYGPRLAPNPMPLEAFLPYLRKPSGAMPRYSPTLLPDQEVADVHAFLTSVPPPVDISAIPTFKK